MKLRFLYSLIFIFLAFTACSEQNLAGTWAEVFSSEDDCLTVNGALYIIFEPDSSSSGDLTLRVEMKIDFDGLGCYNSTTDLPGVYFTDGDEVELSLLDSALLLQDDKSTIHPNSLFYQDVLEEKGMAYREEKIHVLFDEFSLAEIKNVKNNTMEIKTLSQSHTFCRVANPK